MRTRGKLKNWFLLVSFLFGVGALGAIRESRAGGDVVWAKNLEAGETQARQTGKPMLLSFHTPGCGWCQKLDAETFTDPKVVELARHFVCVRLESDLDVGAVERFQVLEYPMTIFVDSQGKEVSRFSGYVPPERFAPALSALLELNSKSSR